ncbi:hypothetical protein F8M41_025286 [Gigaspora margarita]|uniref:Uncharacterized protein n=1 Tax=Gigaspora margarita TaxID=4874 RepID=A0A8H4A9Z7_GIGMA|nr:hypothetical protein F8M41_025286 [Gigaspora margarita]
MESEQNIRDRHCIEILVQRASKGFLFKVNSYGVQKAKYITGIAYTTYDTIEIVNNAVYSDKGLYSISIIVDTLLCVVAAFGLFVICVVETAYLLKLYVRFVYALLVLKCLNFVFIILIFASYKSDYINFCKTNYIPSNVHENESVRTCNITYITSLLSIIFISVFAIILMIYFAIIISVYEVNCKAKDNGYDTSEVVIETPGSNYNDVVIETPGSNHNDVVIETPGSNRNS